jgi:hypothetical protein
MQNASNDEGTMALRKIAVTPLISATSNKKQEPLFGEENQRPHLPSLFVIATTTNMKSASPGTPSRIPISPIASEVSCHDPPSV